MFLLSLHTDDECLYFGIEKGIDNAKKKQKSEVVAYRCCPVSSIKPNSRLSVLSETDLGSSKTHDENEITFVFEKEEAVKPKDKKNSKNDSKKKEEKKKSESTQEVKPKEVKKEKVEKKEAKEEVVVKEKKKKERDVKEKEPKDSKDNKDDKKEKKGKDKKDKGKNTHDDDDEDGYFQLGNWW